MDTLTPYKRYYQKNKDVLLAKQRERYDPDAKKKYYTENQTVIKEKMKQMYITRRNNEAKAILEDCLLNASEQMKDVLRNLLKTQEYKDMKPSAIQTLKELALK